MRSNHGGHRRGLLALFILAALTVAMVVPTASSAANPTIGTGSSPAEGFYALGLFQATVGQVITVPAGDHHLQGFTFDLTPLDSAAFRAYVYAWNGTHAVGPALYESPTMHGLEVGVLGAVTVNSGRVAVTPGAQYVLFFSISANKSEDEGISGGLFGELALTSSVAYTEGAAIELQNEYRPSAWTSESWTNNGLTYDLVFDATFATAATVSSVAPTSAEAGQAVTITGSEFAGASQVLFGATPAASFTVEGEDKLVAVVPSGLSGVVDVHVVSEEGTSASSEADRLTITQAPTVSATVTTSATPASVPAVTSTPVVRCVVPKLRGMDMAAVQQALIAAHCALGRVSHHYNAMPLGGLVEQSLHQGTFAASGARVAVWFSLGAHKPHAGMRRHV